MLLNQNTPAKWHTQNQNKRELAKREIRLISEQEMIPYFLMNILLEFLDILFSHPAQHSNHKNRTISAEPRGFSRTPVLLQQRIGQSGRVIVVRRGGGEEADGVMTHCFTRRFTK